MGTSWGIPVALQHFQESCCRIVWVSICWNTKVNDNYYLLHCKKLKLSDRTRSLAEVRYLDFFLFFLARTWPFCKPGLIWIKDGNFNPTGAWGERQIYFVHSCGLVSSLISSCTSQNVRCLIRSRYLFFTENKWILQDGFGCFCSCQKHKVACQSNIVR